VVVAFALLQPGDRQHDEASAPAQRRAHLLVARHGHETRRIDARRQHGDALTADSPTAFQQRGRVPAVGDQQRGAREDAPRHPGQLAAGAVRDQLLPVHEAAEWTAAGQGEPPFRQHAAAVHRTHICPPAQPTHCSGGTAVRQPRRRIEGATVDERECQPRDAQVVAAVELGVAGARAGSDHHVGARHTPVQLPKPARRPADVRRKDFAQQQRGH
jgi:hypothetical protein